ncbi:MAG: alanine racemase, partial [Patescibacteria group bacterium]
MDTKLLNTWIEISESAYVNNLNFFKAPMSRLNLDIGTGKAELAVVIKANAYGHGMLEIAGMAAKNGVNFFCVHSLDEAKEIRKNGFNQNILVMGHVPMARLEEAVELNLQLALYNLESLQALDKVAQKLGKMARVHLKLETGANRQGVTE